jgi:hypothetical protein
MALVILAIVHFEDNEQIHKSKTELDFGAAIACISWALLAIWALWSLAQSRRYFQNENTRVVRSGKVVSTSSDSWTPQLEWVMRNEADNATMQLLFICFVALPLVALRIAWGVAFLELKVHHPTSDFLTSLPITVCLSVVPEMLIMAAILVAGVCTHQLFEQMKTGPVKSGRGRVAGWQLGLEA